MLKVMAQTNDELALLIGSRVREARLSRGLTLDDLAAASGVSRRMVVNVEQGTTNPSVGTLLRLSGALRLSLPALVEPAPSGPVTTTRAGEAPVLWTGEHGGRGMLVAGVSGPPVIELWEWELPPGEAHENEAHTPGTTELVHVLEGVLTLVVGGQGLELQAGDSASFLGDQPHSYRNTGGTGGLTRLSLAVYEPAPAPLRRRAPGGSGR